MQEQTEDNIQRAWNVASMLVKPKGIHEKLVMSMMHMGGSLGDVIWVHAHLVVIGEQV